MRRVGLGEADLELVAATLAVKAAVLIGGVAAVWLASGALADPFTPWDRWDAPHYTDLAVFGYRAEDPGTLSAPGYEQVYPGDLDLYIVFFPLFPWLVAAVRWIVGAPVVAAFVVSGVASLFVAPLLYRLVAADLPQRVARTAALMLLLFPTAYFLHVGYTESLFLALAFGSLWLARRDRWLAAGVVGGLAALARINGLVLVPVLLVEAWLQWRGRADGRPATIDWRPLVSVVLVAAGFAGYIALNAAVYGDPFAFSEVQRTHWGKAPAPPWVGIAGIFGRIRHPNADAALMLGWVELLFVALGLAATVATAIRLRPTWTAWMAGNWLLTVSTGLVMSTPRYSLVLFGIPVLAALAFERSRALGFVLATASVLALAYFAWRFAIGLWAF